MNPTLCVSTWEVAVFEPGFNAFRILMSRGSIFRIDAISSSCDSCAHAIYDMPKPLIAPDGRLFV